MRRKKIICIIFFALLSISYGCGSNNVLIDYAKDKNTTESILVCDKTEERIQICELPQAQIDGEPLCDDFKVVGDKTVHILLQSLIYDMERLYTYHVLKITDKDVHEAEIISNLFGTSGNEIKTVNENEANDYSEEILQYCREVGKSYGEEPVNAITTWFDMNGDYLHMYSGFFSNVEYDLVISYSNDDQKKRIIFYPRNPGDVMGEPKLDKWFFLKDSSEMINGIKISEMSKKGDDLQNRSTYSDNTRLEMIVAFCRDVLLCNISVEDFCFGSTLETANYSKRSILYYQNNENSKPDLDSALMDGYAYDMSLLHDRNTDKNDNRGRILVTDNGVVGFDLTISYDILDDTKKETMIMSIAEIVEALKTVLIDVINDSVLFSNEKIVINQFQLVYYLTTNQDRECIIIPAWKIPIVSNDYCPAVLYLNAIDGELLEIEIAP